MIAIYALMVAMMSIIFGSRSKNKVLGQVQYPCQRCGRMAFHTLVRSQRWFSLYFIPLIPMSKTTTTRCNLCGYQAQIDNNQADAMVSQGMANSL
jgi:ribosomal protein L37E